MWSPAPSSQEKCGGKLFPAAELLCRVGRLLVYLLTWLCGVIYSVRLSFIETSGYDWLPGRVMESWN